LNDFTNFTKSHKGQKVTFDIKRENQELSKDVTISEDSNAPLGVAVVDKAIVRVPVWKAPYIALRETWEVLALTFKFLGSTIATLFSTGKVSEGVGGPVAIYAYTGLAVKAGFMVLLQFIAILSINLGLINILPFPALDGGRLVFIILEKIYGKRVLRESVENIVHTVGFAFLILLMILISYHDVVTRIHH
jgi:regulator of sigma E protease